jgi:hypothetical protein
LIIFTSLAVFAGLAGLVSFAGLAILGDWIRVAAVTKRESEWSYVHIAWHLIGQAPDWASCYRILSARKDFEG